MAEHFIAFTVYPGDGEVFADSAFDDRIGVNLPVLVGSGLGAELHTGRLVAAEVTDDGRSALVTLETAQPLPLVKILGLPGDGPTDLHNYKVAEDRAAEILADLGPEPELTGHEHYSRAQSLLQSAADAAPGSSHRQYAVAAAQAHATLALVTATLEGNAQRRQSGLGPLGGRWQ